MRTGHFESDRCIDEEINLLNEFEKMHSKTRKNESENSEVTHCIKSQEVIEIYDCPCPERSWRKKMILIFKHLPCYN